MSENTKRETFLSMYRRFQSKKGNADIVNYNSTKYSRCAFRDMYMKEKKSYMISQHTEKNVDIEYSIKDGDVTVTEKQTPKHIQMLDFINENQKPSPEHIIKKTMKDPFQTMNIVKMTNIQTFVKNHISSFSKFQSFLYTASCGAGKTLAGIYAIYTLRCKTLIVSHRNAIKDQWETVLEKCFPSIVIASDEYHTADVYIMSPQYLSTKTDKMKLPISLIIYDEIHAFTSDVFQEVLKFPYMCVLDGRFSQLPFMIGLSATLPPTNSKERQILKTIFGNAFAPSSSVTEQPIYVWDYRNCFTEVKRGKFDEKYTPLDDYEAIEYFVKQIEKDKSIVPTSTKFKGIIMTSTITSSMFAALYVHLYWNINVLLIRAAHEKCVFLEKDKGTKISPYTFNKMITEDKFYEDIDNFGSYCQLQERIDNCSIVVGCISRLKEGFSVESITWGIITQFVWSVGGRVQLLGRIRRQSQDEKINSHKRICYVCSRKAPNNQFAVYNAHGRKSVKQAIAMSKITYDFEYEDKMFAKENIQYVEIHPDD